MMYPMSTEKSWHTTDFLTARHFHITVLLFIDHHKIYPLDMAKSSLYYEHAILFLRSCLTYGK